MMKIKDNIDLKILKKYPFESSDSGSIFWSSKDCSREEYEDMTNANESLNVENYDLKEENQELKKYLKVPETCNLKTLEDYKSYYEDTTREQILEDTYIEYCAYVNLAHRYSKLKKQLKPNYYVKGLEETLKEYQQEMNKVAIQQKKFIKYLEDEINKISEQIKNYDLWHEVGTDINYLILKKQFNIEILQKYKSMIGDDKE